MDALELYLIKPTRYDDEGYPLQWWRSIVPSNSLACLAGIALDAAPREPLGEGIAINVHPMDEINTPIVPDEIIRNIRASGNPALIGLVGVQSNQFPRAVDLAREFRYADIPVCIGGFHVSGCLSMLKDMPPDLVEAQDLGISFFAGEAEDRRFDEVLIDAFAGVLKPVYNHLRNTPNLAGAPIPQLPTEQVIKNINRYSSFDLGRGCPFECSFCTIINVQGRKSRYRTADDLERIVRENHGIGINRFFLTDDNFARNKNWRAFTDRLIGLRDEGIPVRLAIQVDTLAHQIEGFVDQCVAAGADQIFIGLESVNSDSLEAVKKRQNRIEEYRDMFLDWKRHPVLITCGFIVGFPNDTKESIAGDIELIKHTMPIDTLYLNYLTPLPGSEDHKVLADKGIWMDPDMNKYDLNHRVTHHPIMSDGDWEDAYRSAHRSFYSWEHMNRILKRMVALRSNKKLTTVNRLLAYREAVRLEGVSALESGYVRIRRRRQRRHGWLIESPLVFYPKNAVRLLATTLRLAATYARLRYHLRRALRDPARFHYSDAAIDGSGSQDALYARTRVTPQAQRRIVRMRPRAGKGHKRPAAPQVTGSRDDSV